MGSATGAAGAGAVAGGGGAAGTDGGVAGTDGGLAGMGGGGAGMRGGFAGTGGALAGMGGGAAGARGGTGGTTGGAGTTGAAGAGGAPPSAGCPAPASPSGSVFYVATNGANQTSNGTSASPWATIEYALGRVPDGATIVVRPGTYNGQVRLEGVFSQGVRVVSEQPYRAMLRHTATVVIAYDAVGITLEGFDIAHAGAGAAALVIQIQNLRGSGEPTGRITLRNNVLHDSHNNDILKINNGAAFVTVEGNVFYNQAGSDEHIDVNSVTDVLIQDNIFFSDFAGSGRSNTNETSSFVVVKDSNGADDDVMGSDRITIRRNVFLNWEGSSGSNFLLLGEDGMAYYEARNVTVENNLFLGNSSNGMRSAFGVKGCRDVTFRNNTVAGNLPASEYAFRLNREGSNLADDNIRFFNNIWSDPTGTMGDFSDAVQTDVIGSLIRRNLYWNGGSTVPSESADVLAPNADAMRVVADPGLPAQSGIALPRWNPSAGTFGGGASAICAAHRALVEGYGAIAGTQAVDGADPAQAPAEDILRRPRPAGAAPDFGAYERQ